MCVVYCLSLPEGRSQVEMASTEAAPQYKLEELTRLCELGKGRLARVYLYRHKEKGDLVAVKQVEKANVLSKGLVQRVMGERNTLRKLASSGRVCRNLPEFYGNAQDDQHLSFFLEPLLAGALHLHIAENCGLPERSARFYASEVAAALRVLHELGIAHRDVKASNVVLK